MIRMELETLPERIDSFTIVKKGTYTVVLNKALKICNIQNAFLQELNLHIDDKALIS